MLVSWQTKSAIAKGAIKQIIKDGVVPNLPIKLTATSDRPIALVEVWRDEKPSGDLVGVPWNLIQPIDLLQMPMMEEEEGEEEEGGGFVCPECSQQQLDKINQVCGDAVGLGRITSKEVCSVSFVAADNLLNRRFGKWTVRELRQLVSLSIGNPLTLDHDWDEVEKSQGVIYDARCIQGDSADPAIDCAGNGAINRDIVSKEGHWQTIIDVAFPIYSNVLSALRFGKAGKVSCGGFAYKDTWCPLCDLSFSDPDCPHGIPMPQWGITSETDERIAPYYIRKDLYDLGEVSLVLISNLPNAGIVKKKNQQ